MTTLKKGVGVENAILTNLNTNACCQTTINEKLLYFLTIHANCKTIWAFENSLLGIRAIMENARLIASCPFKRLQRLFVSEHIKRGYLFS